MSYIELGPTLRRLRKERKLKQGEVAIEIGCGEQSIHIWECGKHDPQWQFICALATFYGLEVEELVSQAKRHPKQ